MKKRTLLIAAIATTTLLTGGWALAHTAGYGPHGKGPAMMHGMMGGQMGPGMMHGGMGGRMGPGMMHGTMGGQMGPGMMHGGMGPGMTGAAGVTFADPTRIDALKADLAITADQEAAWIKYATALQDAANTMKTAHEGVDHETVGKLGPRERFAFMTTIREQGQEQFQTVHKAATELLAALDDTQKAKARTSLPGLSFGPGVMHGGSLGGPPFRH
jgi:hypothetical protein